MEVTQPSESLAPEPLSVFEDRSIKVPPGSLVRTGYVDVFSIRLACRERMAVGDVSAAYQKVLQLGTYEQFPCPNGYWKDGVFWLMDGRHQWVASVMLGKTHILVSWVTPAENNFTDAAK